MKTKVISILNEIRSEFDFSTSANFIDDGMLDSFDIVTLVVMLDEEFNISITGTDIIPENFSTLEAITNLLSKYEVQP
jgi:acyl carrier protein